MFYNIDIICMMIEINPAFHRINVIVNVISEYIRKVTTRDFRKKALTHQFLPTLGDWILT